MKGKNNPGPVSAEGTEGEQAGDSDVLRTVTYIFRCVADAQSRCTACVNELSESPARRATPAAPDSQYLRRTVNTEQRIPSVCLSGETLRLT